MHLDMDETLTPAPTGLSLRQRPLPGGFLRPAALRVVGNCAWFVPRSLGFPLAIAALAVIRRLYLRPLNRAILKGLMLDYGSLRGTVGHVAFCFVHNTLGFLGRLVSPWLHRHVMIIPPMTTPLTVLKTVDSKAENV